ncbi:TonB-dependent receptor [Acetobacter senegalensis]|uniref:TonB-dependent receptor n=1 Tax=Acetobacter senegalensis TaxID=446692 RepID=UPI00265246DC|nr:TonB-dependent receptor [Acetobacter senegalensis]MDN7354580.1 TonB-dependent receptor [Acetobacter senegalensis]
MRVYSVRRRLRPAPLAVGLTLGCTAAFGVAEDQACAATADHSLTDAKNHGHRHHKRDHQHAEASVKGAPVAATPPAAAQGTKATLANAKGNGPTLIAGQDGTEAEEWTVTASPMNTLRTPIGLSRMPQDVLHTPQTIDVVPQILMQQQNVKSLDEALKNVPGITASVGEGEGGMAGDQFLIRGFAAQNDIYENGLRDFGVYTRDSFDYDHVTVIKGPSSQVFGNGTTGGAINITTKTPTAANHVNASFSGGSGAYYRGTLDFNHKITDSIAFRITGMGNESNMVGRDAVYSHRWGIAPSIIFGLGKKVNYTIEYLHQTDNRIPDYGVPVVTKPGASYGKPVTEYGVRRTNWYGTTFDQDASNVDMLTGRLHWELNKYVTVYNDTRGGLYSRYFSASQESCDATCTSALFSSNPQNAVVSRIGGVGGPNPYQQNDWSVQNVASAVANFNTGSIKHQMIGGFDIEHIYDRRQNYAYNNPAIRRWANLLNPVAYIPGLDVGVGSLNPGNLVNIPNGVGRKEWKTSAATDVGAFFSEQAWLAPWFSIKAGFRWDHWSSNYNATGGVASTPDTHLGQKQDTFNPNVSLMYTPNDHTMVYFNWAESTTPLGLYVTNSSEPLSPKNSKFKPERSRLYEIGAKYSAFHDRIGFTASVFRLEKGNSMLTDPSSGEVTDSGDTQRNQGLELSVSGQILKNWNMIATYARYDSKTTGGTLADIGKQIQYVPRNQATVWSTYEIAPKTPYNLTVGGGVTWREGVFLDPANTARVPANVEFDAVVSHEFGSHWRVAMNGYNLANRLNYGNLFSNRVTPSIGRAFLFQLSANY